MSRYAAGLAEYYMQLEDDVQAVESVIPFRFASFCLCHALWKVVPSFLPTVRRYMRESMPDKPSEAIATLPNMLCNVRDMKSLLGRQLATSGS